MAVTSNLSAGQVLTASTVNNYMINSGLVWIATDTFSGATARNITNCFSSNFRNYRVFIDFTQNSVTGNLWLRFLTGTSTEMSSNYGYLAAGNYTNGTTQTFAAYTGNLGGSATQIYLANPLPGHKAQIVMDISNPFVADGAIGRIDTAASAQGGPLYYIGLMTSFQHAVGTSRTGLRIFTDASGGTITGQVSVYGYRTS